MIGDNSNPDMSHEGTFRWVGLPALHSYWDIVAHWVTQVETGSPNPGPPVSSCSPLDTRSVVRSTSSLR